MIDLPADQLKTVKQILKASVPDCEVRVFGSRVTGKAKSWSDLDLLLRGNQAVEETRIFDLKEAFEESGLPIQVDVLDFHTLSADFLSAIQEQPMERLDF